LSEADDQLEMLINEAELGEEARAFLESALFREISKMAEKGYEDALIGLSKVDPSKTEDIRKLQNQVQLYEHFDEWLKEIVYRGNQALEIYKHESQSQ
jgi:hypothetical protein